MVDLERQRLVAHRDGDPQTRRYRQVEVVKRGGEVSPGALSLAPLSTEDLFATALGERG